MTGRTLVLQVDGYEVLATFTDTPNTTITHHLKQILMASFVNNTSRSASGDSLATVSKRRYNQDGDPHCAP